MQWWWRWRFGEWRERQHYLSMTGERCVKHSTFFSFFSSSDIRKTKGGTRKNFEALFHFASTHNFTRKRSRFAPIFVGKRFPIDYHDFTSTCEALLSTFHDAIWRIITLLAHEIPLLHDSMAGNMYNVHVQRCDRRGSWKNRFISAARASTICSDDGMHFWRKQFRPVMVCGADCPLAENTELNFFMRREILCD